MRTNFYQRGSDGQPSDLIALKFDSKAIDAAPQPKPYREIWVYSPRVEGVHLRFAPIARGGIRWSDRAQDFRTEVLGLVKAQLVKNAVIVPSGAKGGFLPKQLPRARHSRRDHEGRRRRLSAVHFGVARHHRQHRRRPSVPPQRVVRHDGDDPYLVVAADKGTATFSDFANEISRRARPLARRRVRLRRLGRLRPQEDGHHRARRLGMRQAAFPRDGLRHPDDAVPRHRRRRHVGRRVRQRHAAVAADPAGRSLRSSRHLHRSRARSRPPASPSANACSICRAPAGRTTTRPSISRGGGVFSAHGQGIPLSPEMQSAAWLAERQLRRRTR